MKTAKIKSKSRSFTVNYNISNNGDRSVVQCKLAKGEAAVVRCLKGPACSGIQTAAAQD